MERIRFNDGWSHRTKANRFDELTGGASPFEPVALPHDAMISTVRSPSAPAANGYFPGGAWEYTKTFSVEPEQSGQRLFLHFEGVYRSALVTVNGVRAGQRPYGYAGFTIRIDELVRVGENTVHVEAVAGDDTRWYSGAGIYRNVHLLVGGPVRFGVDGLRVTTVEVDGGRAVVEVTTQVENDATEPAACEVAIELTGPDGSVVASDRAVVTSWPGRPQTLRRRLTVGGPALWSIDQPSLHTCVATLSGDGRSDRSSTTFGIRTIHVDADRGFRINGEPVKLRGAAVHHDNGVLGAATFERAEERRVELLKAAGFNALRSAHNPMSEAMLDACDRLGMVVMDETFDTWTEPKMLHDYARSFEDWWRLDVEAMVAKDVNHPSVVMYSIGNEVPELGGPDGARRSRELADHVRSLDPTRFVTNGVNPVLAVGAELFMSSDLPPMPEMGINSLMTIMQDYLPLALRSDVVDRKLRESFETLDVAGYNYLETRYELDHELHPHRVIVGTETLPPLIGRYWPSIRDSPHVIGDFTWTGWDYLGEAGIGRLDRGTLAGEGLVADHPWLTASAGDLDITGFRRPISYLREIVYGLRREPYIAVQDPRRHDEPVVHQSPWSLTDAVASWSWPVADGDPVTVEVYADGDEVELLLDGRSVGRQPAGEAAQWWATFETTYQRGEITAVARKGGEEIGRTSLRSAGEAVELRAEVDREQLRADGSDLAFVTVRFTDDQGVPHVAEEHEVQVAISGPAVLAGLGSATPSTEESFLDPVHRTHLGRALAVVRPTGAGAITVAITSAGSVPASLQLEATPVHPPHEERQPW